MHVYFWITLIGISTIFPNLSSCPPIDYIFLIIFSDILHASVNIFSYDLNIFLLTQKQRSLCRLTTIILHYPRNRTTKHLHLFIYQQQINTSYDCVHYTSFLKIDVSYGAACSYRFLATILPPYLSPLE